MRVNSVRWWWVFGNIAWFVFVPVLFGLWLSRGVEAQYEAGLRTATQGDSLSIPIGIAILLNAAFMLLVNAALGAALVVRKVLELRKARMNEA